MNVTYLIFFTILLVTGAITFWAGMRTHTTSDFYAASGALTARQNGFALAGDFCSAATFLGFTGLTALFGLDGALYALGGLASLCIVLFVAAEPLRNIGRYTLGDAIFYRMQKPHALLAAICSTITVNFAYLIPQMVGAGVTVRLLTGIPYTAAIAMMGLCMIIYVAVGGMIATTWVQIVKAVMMLGVAAIILILCLRLVQFNPLTFFEHAEVRYGADALAPGKFFKNPLDIVSLSLSFVFGVAGLPHILTRFYTVPDSQTARKSVAWLMCLAGAFFISTTIFGFAAADLVGRQAITAADKGGNLALPLLAQTLGGGAGSFGGDVMLGLVSAVSVATILAVVAGLTISTSGAIAHDLYVNWLKSGHVDDGKQVLVARWSAVAIGLLAMILGIGAQGMNVAVLVILAICVAASANFPVLLLSLFWRRFNTGGVIGGIAVGLTSSVVLALLGPAVSGPAAVWPLVNPTILSLPLGFLGAVTGSLLAGRDAINEERFDQVLMQLHTGKPVS
jgi:cation/acetate symporter